MMIENKKRMRNDVCVRINQTSGSLLPLERGDGGGNKTFHFFLFRRRSDSQRDLRILDLRFFQQINTIVLDRCLYDSPFAYILNGVQFFFSILVCMLLYAI